MACRCGCGFDTVDYELLVHLQFLRAHFGRPVTLISVCRCPAHNASVGGVDDSQHTVGKAADIVVAGLEPAEVHRYFDSRWPEKYGLGLYRTFVHFDVRSGRAARWSGNVETIPT